METTLTVKKREKENQTTTTGEWKWKNVLSKQKAQKKLVPEGWQREAPTPRQKLHDGGMIMCKHTKEKDKRLESTGDRCINMLCWVSKGISLFCLLFIFFYSIFFGKIFLEAAT